MNRQRQSIELQPSVTELSLFREHGKKTYSSTTDGQSSQSTTSASINTKPLHASRSISSINRLSHTRRELLISGYFYQSCRNTHSIQNLPDILCETCVLYLYSVTLSWHLMGPTYTKFLTSKQRTASKKRIILIKCTKLECVLVKKPNEAQLYLRTDFNNAPLRTYYELFCRETGNEIRGVRTFGKTALVAMNVDSLEQHASGLSLYIYLDPTWFAPSMSRRMHRQYSYSWTLAASELRHIQSEDFPADGHLLSDNFDNDHWYLKCVPKQNNSVSVYLVLLAVRSEKVYSMNVSYRLQSNYNNITHEGTKVFYAVNSESDTFGRGVFPSTTLQSLKELSFTATIAILDVYSDVGDRLQFNDVTSSFIP